MIIEVLQNTIAFLLTVAIKLKHLFALSLLLIFSNALYADEINAHCPSICINDSQYFRGNVQLLYGDKLKKGVKVIVTDNYGKTIFKKRFRWSRITYYYDDDIYFEYYVQIGSDKHGCYFVILSEDDEYDFYTCEIYETGWCYNDEE